MSQALVIMMEVKLESRHVHSGSWQKGQRITLLVEYVCSYCT